MLNFWILLHEIVLVLVCFPECNTNTNILLYSALTERLRNRFWSAVWRVERGEINYKIPSW